jgi:hypothetical protein
MERTLSQSWVKVVVVMFGGVASLDRGPLGRGSRSWKSQLGRTPSLGWNGIGREVGLSRYHEGLWWITEDFGHFLVSNRNQGRVKALSIHHLVSAFFCEKW